MDEINEWYAVVGLVPTGWVHAEMVYHGVEQGLTAYQDGIEIGADLDIATAGPKTSGNGLVYIDKRNFGVGYYYSSASVDEIKMYNRQLTQQEICDMY